MKSERQNIEELRKYIESLCPEEKMEQVINLQAFLFVKIRKIQKEHQKKMAKNMRKITRSQLKR